MIEKERKIKNVSFSLKDEYEVELLEYAEKPYNGKKRDFSKFVKRLIAEEKKRNTHSDARSNTQGYNQTKVVDSKDKGIDDNEFYTTEVKDAMSSFFTKGMD